MRIGILVESFPRISETWLVNQIIDLVNRGYEVSIYSVYHSKDVIFHQHIYSNNLIEKTQFFFNPKGNSFQKVLSEIVFFIKNMRKIQFFKLILGVRAVLTNNISPLFGFNFIFLKGLEDLDILHAHFGHMGVIASSMKKAGLLGGAKVIVSFHGQDLFPYKRLVYQKEYQIFNNFASSLLVNSLYSKSLLNEITLFPQVKVIPVGLSLDYFKPDCGLNNKVRLIFLGRLVYLKGGLIMIKIFYRLFLKNPYLELVIIGDGEQRDEIEIEIKAYGLENFIFLKGALSQDNIIDEMKSASIFVYPGLTDPIFKAGDTQGLVIQEAQSMELPVVCSDVGGVKYGLIEGKTGFLVKEGDIEGFVERIQYLIDHPEVRIKMGKAGRSFVKQKFDSKVIGDQLEKLYYEVLQPN